MSIKALVNSTVASRTVKYAISPAAGGSGSSGAGTISYTVNGITLGKVRPDGGQTIFVTGSGFTEGSHVLLNGQQISTSFVSSSVVSFIAPVLTEKTTYPMALYYDNGSASAIVPGIICGTIPVWTTAAGLIDYVVSGTSYSTTLVGTDSDSGETLTYTVVSGTLPTGLTLDTSTGVISGTTSGNSLQSTFTVRLSNHTTHVDREFSIYVLNGVIASGGTTVTVGSYKYHTFTSSGTLTVTHAGPASVLLVGGGGGAGAGTLGGGGGAGGYVYIPTVDLTTTTYSIVVGTGGAGAAPTSAGSPYGSDGVIKYASNGTDSTAFGYTAMGGGRGATLNESGVAGGSGGGSSVATANSGGASTQNSTYGYGVGFAGGIANTSTSKGGGGGGAGSVGAAGASYGGAGGSGLTFQSNDTLNLAGGGQGGGAQFNLPGTNTYGAGNAAYYGSTAAGSNAAVNSGSGGGGGSTTGCCYGFYMSAGGNGGTGIVIIKYAI